MKILIDNNHGFSFAHGGIQTFIENLLQVLPTFGCEAEPLRWWDASQTGDLVHFFYRPNDEVAALVRSKCKVVTSLLLGPYTSLNPFGLFCRQAMFSAMRKFASGTASNLGLSIAQHSDAFIFYSPIEREIGQRLFSVSSNNSHVVLPGVAQEYLKFRGELNPGRKDYLVTLSTIYPVKNSVYLARLAKRARIPICFLGKPFDIKSGYFSEFRNEIDNRYVVYLGDPPAKEKAQIMHDSRAFILVSSYESAPVVVSEASACGCPLILADRMWARTNYDGYAHFLNISDLDSTARRLREYYENVSPADTLYPVKSWQEVGASVAGIYRRCLEETTP
jgi:glycosyltransferase involved in cell wall biosynthesis